MKQKDVVVKLEQGLEARPAAMLVQVASKHNSSVYLESEGRKVNAKSIMGMMSLALAPGESVTVIADGSDEDEALVNMENYLACAGA
ncbi:MAG: HPr family phosphocarrier protein [Eisenbergiella sp.]